MQRKTSGLIAAASVIIYLVLFVSLRVSFGEQIAIVAVIPVIAIGLLYGRRGGLIAGALTLPVSILLYYATGEASLSEVLGNFSLGKSLGHVVQMLIGGVVGHMRDLSLQTGIALKDQEAAETALREANRTLETRVAERTAALENMNAQLKRQIQECARVEAEIKKQRDALDDGNKKLTAEIRERKKAVEDLTKTKEQLENLIESSIDPIDVGDNSGNIVKTNNAFVSMLGYPEEDIIGEPAFKFSITEEGSYESTTGETVTIDAHFFQENADRITRLFEDGKISNWFTYYVNKDHKLIPVTQNIVLLYNAQHELTGSFGIIRDITEQKKTESDLRKAKEAAEEAARTKSNFLANMSHEIRTPMNGVIGFTDMLLDTALDEEQTEYAQTIKRSGEALLTLINDILDISKIEAGRIDIEEIDFDIEVLACDVCELMRPRLADKNVKMLLRVGDDLPAWVRGDPHRIKQILVNLAGNAAKFTEQGEVELALEVEQEQDEWVVIHTKVRDTGIGIPESKLDAIFDLFQQADDSITRRYGGTGLGLSICKKMAAVMGGDVWAESQPGKGSTFHFSARLKQPAKKQIKRFAPVSLAGRKVLITDDNRHNLDILTHLLESAGMQVVGCMNAASSLEVFRQAAAQHAAFDICILDIMMPDMSGYELARKIRALAGDRMPLLAFSSSTERGARKCRDEGFDGFLPKPVSRYRLFEMIAKLLTQARDSGAEKDGERSIVTQYSLREDAKHAVSILLVEDNPVNQRLAERLLTKAGYSVDVAGDGRQAVDLFVAQPNKFDVIFMDVQMPVLNGLDASRMLRDRGFDSIPVIAMTANAMQGDREKCLAAGMNDYIAKPIKREVVFEILKKWVIDKAPPEAQTV